MKDWLERELNIGDVVVYPTRIGSSLYLHQGKILQIDEERGKMKLEKIPRAGESWNKVWDKKSMQWVERTKPQTVWINDRLAVKVSC